MTLPSTGISSTLVGNELGTSSHAWGVLCNSSNINPFSKYKPVDWTETNTDSISNKWLGKSNDCNIDMGYSNGDPIATCSKVWRYRKVSETSLPNRIGDFRSYQHSMAEYKSYGAPVYISIALEVNNANSFIINTTFKALSGDLLGLKDLINKRIIADGWANYTIGMLIVNESTTQKLFFTSDYLAVLSNEVAFSDIELRIQSPTNYPTVFKESTYIRTYVFVCNAKLLTPELNPAAYPSMCLSLRALSSFPEYYRTFVEKYIPPSKFTISSRVAESAGWNYHDVDIYLKISIDNLFLNGGTLNYRLLWSNGRNISSPSLPITETGSISMNAGSPIGTIVEKKVSSKTFYASNSGEDCRVTAEFLDVQSGLWVAQTNIEWTAP